ncbi:MAG: hypothetical protein IT285_08230 [Bdellovibrionales bacterium]|nr:hypothetical protein [Bdellovibrionales bacterium]
MIRGQSLRPWIIGGALLALQLGAPSAHAYEVDNITGRSRPLPDSRGLLNAETNRRLEAAVAAANAAGTPCVIPAATGGMPPPIFTYVRNQLNSNPVAEIESWAEDHLPSANQISTDLSASIYNGISVTDAPVLRFAGLEATINLGGQRIGIDKLGHFMAQGFEYFELVWAGGRVRDALDHGRSLEDGMYGMATTSVRSFGDLGANFSGMNFYRDLLYGASPILGCDGGRWRRLRDFDWGSYVNASWDEGVNCSEFSPAVATVVNGNLARMGVSCPASASSCAALASRACSADYVSPACRAHFPSGVTGGGCAAGLAHLPSPAALAPPAQGATGEAPVGAPDAGGACPPRVEAGDGEGWFGEWMDAIPPPWERL